MSKNSGRKGVYFPSTGKTVYFKTSGKKRRRKSKKLRGLRGLSARWNPESSDKPCVHKFGSKKGKLKPGWTYGKGGVCVPSAGRRHPRRHVGSKSKVRRPSAGRRPLLGKKGKARASAYKARKTARKSGLRYSCQHKVGGKIRIVRGWYIRAGKCWQTGSKKWPGGKRKGKKAKKSRASKRVAARKVKKTATSKYPCIRKSGSKKGKLKQGWYIRHGHCVQSMKGGRKTGRVTRGGKEYSQYLTAKGKVRKGFYFRKTGVYKKGGTKVAGLSGLRSYRSISRRATQRQRLLRARRGPAKLKKGWTMRHHKYPCITVSGPRKGWIKKGWYIRAGKCVQSIAGAKSAMSGLGSSKRYRGKPRKATRRSKGIYQTGSKIGKLKPGYKYSNGRVVKAKKRK